MLEKKSDAGLSHCRKERVGLNSLLTHYTANTSTAAKIAVLKYLKHQ
jgi:hypothetical protein